MTLAHIHLLLNHWPIIGAFVGLFLFLVALFANSDDLKQTSLAFFTLIALLAIPTYFSGDVANEVLKLSTPLPKELVDAHQGAALLSLIFMEITGAVAFLGLWQFSRMSRPAPHPVARWNSAIVLLLSIVTVVLMTITGNTGGAIRHPEIFSGENAASAVGAIGSKIVPAVSHFVTGSSRWVWPILETLHFLGLILIVAAIGALNLRLLGFVKDLPVAPLHRLLPWGIAGLVINIITGILFFIGMPFFYAWNPLFHLKMASVVVAGSILVLFHCSSAFRSWAKLGPGEDPPAFAKFIAASSLFLWLVIIVLGRYLPLTQESLQ
ncbi:MAG: hypothetical protein DMG15_12835 [Acidobacteria bacterium]|nr:MAG: hypothetical protein DMG15_12835 [Acidobacteriota bacterium]